MMETWWQDIRYGARMLTRSPGFTTVAVLTLALGIGANTAIFSVINAVLLRVAPLRRGRPPRLPDRMVGAGPGDELLRREPEGRARPEHRVRVAGRVQRAQLHPDRRRGGGGAPQRAAGHVRRASPTLRKAPVVGRAFTADDDKPGAEPVAILAEGFWERRFGRDPGVVGRRLVLSGEPFTVVGVMPKTLHGSWKTIDVFTPLLRLEDKIGGEKNRGNHPGIYVIAPLEAGHHAWRRARTEVKAHRRAPGRAVPEQQRAPEHDAGVAAPSPTSATCARP